MKKLLFFLLLSLPLLAPFQAKALVELEDATQINDKRAVEETKRNRDQARTQAGKKLSEADQKDPRMGTPTVRVNDNLDSRVEAPISPWQALCDFLYHQLCLLQNFIASCFNYFEEPSQQSSLPTTASVSRNNSEESLDFKKKDLPTPSTPLAVSIYNSTALAKKPSSPIGKERATQFGDEFNSSSIAALQTAKILAKLCGVIKIDGAPTISHFLADQPLSDSDIKPLYNELEQLALSNQDSASGFETSFFEDPIKLLAVLLRPTLEGSEMNDSYVHVDRVPSLPAFLTLVPDEGKSIQELIDGASNVENQSRSPLASPPIFVAIIDRSTSDQTVSNLNNIITFQTSCNTRVDYAPCAIIFSDDTAGSISGKRKKYFVFGKNPSSGWSLYEHEFAAISQLERSNPLPPPLEKTCCIIVYGLVLTPGIDVLGQLSNDASNL